MDADWYKNALNRLKGMPDEMVYAKDIAPVLRMNPSVIVKRAKDGTWDQDNLGKFVISGDSVKFFRQDFLNKCGFLEPKTEKTINQLLSEIVDELKELNRIQMSMMSYSEKVRYFEILQKSAGAATPTL